MVDVGCGLGGSSRHIAKKYGCTAKGVTLSPYQAKRGNAISESQGMRYVGFPPLLYHEYAPYISLFSWDSNYLLFTVLILLLSFLIAIVTVMVYFPQKICGVGSW